jgi:hypothetical protein
MNLTDDEVLARLRASFQATAARTPIGGGRLDELTITRLGKDRRTLVAVFSAAAAVAVIAGTGVVLAGVGTDGGRSVSPASGGLPVPGVACATQNYYVTASAQELSGMTYLLSSVPPGYQLYGAWGTIDRSRCAATTNWYVEYDKMVDAHDTTAIQLEVTPATAPTGTGQALRGELGDLAPTLAPQLSSTAWSAAAAASSAAAQLSSAEAAASRAASAAGRGSSPSALLPSASASMAQPSAGAQLPSGPNWPVVKVDGHPGRFIVGKVGSGTLVWLDSGLIFSLNAPVTGGDPQSVVELAEQLIQVAPTDPRIVAPANCRVPAGSVCPDPGAGS